jgi:aminoglycoside phosphotransferase
MTSSEQKQNVHASERDRVHWLLGEPLLLAGEDRAAYDTLLAKVIEAVQPTDILEQIWTCDAVDRQWEILRQRRFKTALIAANWQEALREILQPLLSAGEPESMDDDKKAGQLAWRYTLGGKRAIKEVEAMLRQANLTKEAIYAHAMARQIAAFEAFDRLIWAAEARRDASLREIEYHRAPFGQRLRCAIAQVEQVEKFENVEKAEISKIEAPTGQKQAA